MRSPYDLRSPCVTYSSDNEEQEGRIPKGRAPARFAGILFGHQPGAEGEGREKAAGGPTASQPLCSGLLPSPRPTHLHMPRFSDWKAALMPLAAAQVYLQGSARFKDQINFLADVGLVADCQR